MKVPDCAVLMPQADDVCPVDVKLSLSFDHGTPYIRIDANQVAIYITGEDGILCLRSFACRSAALVRSLAELREVSDTSDLAIVERGDVHA